jgi:DNA-binding response OmpR family regulator
MWHVLVVDNDPAVAAMMTMALEMDGAYRVTTAASAHEALKVVGRDRPDAAVIDVVLPLISGLDLARRVFGWGIPVLLVSGHPVTAERLRQGGYRFLEKPFRIRRLITEIRMLLDHASQRRAELAALLRKLSESGADPLGQLLAAPRPMPPQEQWTTNKESEHP